MKTTVKNINGFSLIELLIVIAIFGVVMAGLYASYSVLLNEGVGQYRLAESEMELGISKNIIERDMSMAGYGLADEYPDLDGNGVPDFSPKAVSATDGTGEGGSDTLTLTGTALGIDSRASQGWSLVIDVSGTPLAPSFLTFNDAREDVHTDDRIIMMDITTEKLLSDSAGWLFRYKDANSNVTHIADTNAYEKDPFVGMLVYGISSSGTSTNPYYAVRYYLASTASSPPASGCAPGTRNLLRAESKSDDSPAGGEPVMNCVLDFQVALGLDADEDSAGTIDVWDNGGVTAAGYAATDLNRRLKQIRAYALVQVGNRDRNYTYSNPDPAYAGTPDTIRVGDLSLLGGATGRAYQLDAEQRKYRWRVVTFAVTPRNLR